MIIIPLLASVAIAGAFTAAHGLRYCGSVSGASSGTQCAVVDLDNGAYRSEFKSGPFVQAQGFDGTAWVQRNGLVSVVDLPGLRRDAVTLAYLQSQGWLRNGAAPRSGRVTLQPAGGSKVALSFDGNTHLLTGAVVDSEYGPDRFDYRDYRQVDGIAWPFATIETDPTGARTVTRLTGLQVLHSIPRAAVSPDRNAKKPALTGVVRVPMRSDAPTYMAHILLPLRIDGRPVQMLFDTGGQNSLNPAAATRLGIGASGAISVGGSGGSSARARIARVKSMAVGDASLDDQRFIIFPLPYQIAHPAYGVRVDGVVGSEILENFRVTIDYAARSFVLSSLTAPSTARGVTVPFWSDGSHAYVQASVDGASGLFGIDTGDPGGVTVFGPFANRHGLYRSKGVRYFGLGIGGADAEDEYRGKTMRLGGVTLLQPIVKVSRSTSGDFSARSVAGNLGADVLSRFTLTFDYGRRTVTFAPNADVRRPFRQDMTGLTVVQRRGGSLYVVAVAEGTPAAEAGVRPGDAIVAVNATRAVEMGVKDFDRYRFADVPFTVTIERGGTHKTLSLRPRLLL
ncbi:MAG TPA: aspartyl protease family protein [Candidatus Baltobacteraceae bacterium]|jgi:hypothetical protein